MTSRLTVRSINHKMGAQREVLVTDVNLNTGAPSINTERASLTL